MKIYKYYSDSCFPCRVLGQILEEILIDYPEIELIERNIGDDSEEMQKELKEKVISSVPTLIFEKDGKEVNRTLGAIGKGMLLKVIEKHL